MGVHRHGLAAVWHNGVIERHARERAKVYCLKVEMTITDRGGVVSTQHLLVRNIHVWRCLPPFVHRC